VTVELQYQRANETPAHYALKQAAVAWLRTNKKCWPMGQEIPLGMNIVDALGVKVDDRGMPVYSDTERSMRLMVIAVQVKVSRQDARRRWRVPANMLYMMTPPGLLDPTELPPDVGLLEADPERVRVRCDSFGMPIAVDGIRIVRRARVVREPEGAEHPAIVLLGMARSFASRMLRGLPLAEWG